MAAKKPKKVERRRRGRPSLYTPAIGRRICRLISSGYSLRTICKRTKLPSRYAVMRWLEQDEEFRNQYARATRDRSDAFFEEAIDEARTAVDRDSAAAAKVKVDTLFRAAAIHQPKVYGEKTRHEHSGPDGAPMEVKQAFDWDAYRRAKAESGTAGRVSSPENSN